MLKKDFHDCAENITTILMKKNPTKVFINENETET